MHNDPLNKLLSGGPGESAINEGESVWNLFVQILLPLILILTFLSVMDILRYKIRGEIVDEQNQRLEQNIEELLGTVDEDGFFLKNQRSILEVQRQKLIQALTEIRPEEFKRLKIALFEAGAEIKMEGHEVTDGQFKAFCMLAREYLVRRSIEYRSDLYARVLRRANVNDPMRLPIRIHGEDEELFDKKQIMAAQAATISKANACFIQNRIIEFINSLHQKSLNLQVEVMDQMYEALLKNPTEMSRRGRKLVQQMLRPDIDDKERTRLSGEIYREINDEVRRKVKGYGFLDAALTQIARLD